MTTRTRVTVPQPCGPSRKSAARVSGTSTAAVRTRTFNISVLRRPNLFAGSSEAALTLLVGSDRGVECIRVEVGPEEIGEIELRVGKLPQQKVRNALLSSGADEQVRLGRIGHRQVRLERLRLKTMRRFRVLGDQPSRGLRDVPP